MKKLRKFWFKNLLYVLAVIVATAGCKKDNGGDDLAFLPTLTTDTVSIIGQLTAQSGGNITSGGGYNVTARGICFSTLSNPTIVGSKVDAGTGIGSFTVILNLAGLTVGETCYVRAYATTSIGTAYGNEVSFIIPQTIFTVGQLYQGGVIAYIDSTNIHGIIAESMDQSVGAEWGCEGIQTMGASGTAIGTGYQNTIDIENTCFTDGIAADLCTQLMSGGYNDWYLPSKEELNQLYINRTSIGGFTDDVYWSSSEHNNHNAWAQLFTTGQQQPEFKSHPNFVRAVRNF
ncbi:MAG TPA: DUF1566 domain-containing protein [Chitinophagales bacterium]|nr:DUF1566 domain-containing protein [Chitinophagales bacterium]